MKVLYEEHDFSEALIHLRHGCGPNGEYDTELIRVAREGWNGKNMCVLLSTAQKLLLPPKWHDDKPKHNVPILWMLTADRMLVPWLASQTDILADDWLTLYDDEGEI